MTYPKRFLLWTNLIIDNIEGGFVNDPRDSGGATNMGITERVARSHGYTGSMRDLPRSVAIDIYYIDYWNNKVMDCIYNGVGLCVYDTSINSGYKRAVILLQRALGVKDDGIMGIDSANAISNTPERVAIDRYNEERLKFYRSLKNYDAFGRGWENRLKILDKEEFKIEREDYFL